MSSEEDEASQHRNSHLPAAPAGTNGVHGDDVDDDFGGDLSEDEFRFVFCSNPPPYII